MVYSMYIQGVSGAPRDGGGAEVMCTGRGANTLKRVFTARLPARARVY